jgi:carbon monoxide dehydrogenase subunit G
MEIKGSHHLKAEPASVWAALADPDVLKACIPGCQSVERLPNNDLRIVVPIEIGPFRATFTGQVRVTSADPPRRVSLAGEGRGRPAGSAAGHGDLELASDRGGTHVRYAGELTVGGKLAEVAADLVGARAKTLATEFFESVGAWLSSKPGHLVDRLDHAPAGVPILGDDPGEAVVEDLAERAGKIADEAEKRLEVAAGNSFLGGPVAWGALAMVVVVAILLVLLLR